MKCYVDLHIHSCLSPCGDDLMTPNNIANMARIKGLDMIAVADHNTARHLPAIDAVCRKIGISLLPAMELTTREEVHLLAYFRTVAAACAFSEIMYAHLPGIRNNPAFFGAQLQLDAEDNPVCEEPKLLIQALDLPLDKLAAMVYEAGGLPVPAHINRGGNGLINVLGFLPPAVKFAALEVSTHLPCPPKLGTYIQLHSSDAHRIEDIFEHTEFLELQTPDADGFFAFLPD